MCQTSNVVPILYTTGQSSHPPDRQVLASCYLHPSRFESPYSSLCSERQPCLPGRLDQQERRLQHFSLTVWSRRSPGSDVFVYMYRNPTCSGDYGASTFWPVTPGAENAIPMPEAQAYLSAKVKLPPDQPGTIVALMVSLECDSTNPACATNVTDAVSSTCVVAPVGQFWAVYQVQGPAPPVPVETGAFVEDV